ncbi:lytic transglycosylase domain-containing protein [Ancylobacter sonchi]|uniref:lytic transglycosylase domain-containing protein n=1 Tax=Ancylobacter sonchi TaxID=1937790 RepID=UPI001BD5F78E|nr:lytic transglycosylase domain-containing protein [Ancylobacter sonchi]MBS7536174.1 lytic transglycosylase domain-containing protein [Ancylobacter sonchi]
MSLEPRRRCGFILPVVASLLLAATAPFVSAHGATPTPPQKPKAAAKTTAKTATAPKPPAKPAAKGKATAAAKPAPAPKPAAKPAATAAKKPEIAVPASANSFVAASATAGAASFLSPAFAGTPGFSPDLKQAIALVEQGNATDALAMADRMRDPGSQALVRWLALRVTARGVGYDQAVAILRAHPTLPTPIVLRRRLEFLLYAENKDPATITAFFAEQRPYSGEGKIALARALFAGGDQGNGAAWLRDAWRNDPLSSDTEATVIAEFGGVLSRADHKYRADKMLYNEDAERGLRAAARAGADVTALAKARVALFNKSAGDPAKLLAAVPGSLRSDPAYLYALAKIQRRAGDDAAAARTLSAAPRDPNLLIDPDEWWVERRLVSRELLDAGDARTAYKIAAETVTPDNEHYIADAQFTAGWIALRFLGDARTAQQYFARIPQGQTHPATLARGFYWQGRALEAAGNTGSARAQYETAAGYNSAYYGQLARARLGRPDFSVRGAPAASAAQRAAFARDEGVQIFKLLQKLDKTALTVALAHDLAERLPDPASVGMLAEVARADGDARTMTVIGKVALSRGMPLEAEAFPTIGVPRYQPIAQDVDRALVFAITRQESMFNSSAVSSAGAAGLMQVMPATGRTIANRTGARLDPAQLRSNPTVNVQFGAAELRALLDNYQNNYVLTFAGYNAGRGNVAKWIAQYGDPRDPSVDPIDWVERIPFSETRNYVQRVMENAQVYKSRFGSRGSLQIEADLRGSRVD